MSLQQQAAASIPPEIQSAEEPYLTIAPTSGWSALNLQQVWMYRDLLFTLAQRDVKLRYRQTALGAIWVVLQPLLAAGIFSLVFGALAGFTKPGIPAIVFNFAGLLAWNLFGNTLNKVSNVLVQNSPLISKVFFPRLVLPISTVYSTIVDFGVSAAVLFVLMLVFRVTPNWSIVLLPVWICLILMLGLGLGLYAAALTVSYRDVQFVIPVVMNLLLYASPVAYSLSQVTERLQENAPQYADLLHNLYLINPLTGLLEAFRVSLLNSDPMPWGLVLYSAIVSILVFLGGAFSFKKMERKFADVI